MAENNEDVTSPFDETERNAMRAFLQRAEVRLSTMHRIGGSFIGGAGLLILLPVLLKDILLGAVVLYTKDIINLLSSSSYSHIQLLPYILLFFPILLVLIIPIYGFILLIRELVLFYFAGNTPGFENILFSPRFALTGIGLSPDESVNVKYEVFAQQYGTDLFKFVFAESGANYFEKIRQEYAKQGIIPAGRTLQGLQDSKVISWNERKQQYNVHSIYREDGDDFPLRQGQVIELIGTAFGLAGVRDRSLVAEVAKSELSLVRHILSLRGIVLRYFKALLVFLWTAVVFLVTLSFIQIDQMPRLAILALGCGVWSGFAPFIVGRPIDWLFLAADVEGKLSKIQESLSQARSDEQLIYFERKIKQPCYIAATASGLAFVIAAIT